MHNIIYGLGERLLNASVSFTVYTLAGKPNSKHDSADGVEDGKCVERILYYRLV